MQNILIVVHVIISVILIVSVLFQQSKQQGLSGSIGGGAETFFGKNKGRTLDALLNKITTVVAILFVISAIALTVVSVNENKKAEEAANTTQNVQDQVVEDVVPEEEEPAYSINEDGALVDAAGVVIAEKDALEKPENFNEAGDLIKPGTDEILVSAADLEKAKADAEAKANAEATENSEGTETPDAAETPEGTETPDATENPETVETPETVENPEN